MYKYKVLLFGEKAPHEAVKAEEWLGFYVSRFVEAKTEEDARDIAASTVINELETKGTAAKGIGIHIEKLERLADSYEFPSPQPGFAFYTQR